MSEERRKQIEDVFDEFVRQASTCCPSCRDHAIAAIRFIESGAELALHYTVTLESRIARLRDALENIKNWDFMAEGGSTPIDLKLYARQALEADKDPALVGTQEREE